MKVIIILVILALLVVVGWLVFGKGGYTIPGLTSPTQQTSQSNALPKEVEVPLNTQNDSNELGTATLQRVNGKLVVKINLKGEPEAASQPAHIHLGSCPTPGVVKYPLTPVVAGESETVLDITGDELPGMQPLSINIHKSEQDMQTYVACGDVKF